MFDQWQLGREGVDDGVLLLVAVQDRRVRIQTGYGLEGIPDAYAARIIDKAIVPRFRDGDLDQGLLDGTKVVVALIDGEDLPAWEAPSMRDVLPAGWRSADSVVALTLLAGFLAGLWRSPPSAPAAGCRTTSHAGIASASVERHARPQARPAIAGLGSPAAGDGCGSRGSAVGGVCGRQAWQRSASYWRCAYRWRACLAGAGAAAEVCAWCCSACSGSVRGSWW